MTDVNALGVIFNNATWYETGHMFLAAYMVSGFLLASVYALGRLRGRLDRYTRLGFMIPFAVAAIATPFQIGVGDIAARAVFTDQPAKFAAMELVQTTGPNAPVDRSAGSWSTARSWAACRSRRSIRCWPDSARAR